LEKKFFIYLSLEEDMMKKMKDIFYEWRKFNGVLSATIDDIPITLQRLRTQKEQARGFMFSPPPEDSFGLYFHYPSERDDLSFWMKNVPFDLDLVVLDEDFQVKKILHLKANDETSVEVGVPSRHVIELRHGWCEENGIKEGSQLSFD
jgi:uncharacterized membrane protein (UPF0127 family)